MAAITQQKCFNHHSREAAARCPSCSRYYCRECITEHDGRMTCATCLAKQADVATPPARNWWPVVAGAGRLALSLIWVWAMFMIVGYVLLHIPSEFHDRAFWSETLESDS